MQQHTNEITPELINALKNPAPPGGWDNADAEQRQLFKSHAEEMKPRTLLAIWRFATEGSVSRQGGKIEQGSANALLMLSDGSRVRKAMVGDYVVYPDGTRSRIISGSGFAATNGNGTSYALVGSQLDNGDEIVSTPQDMSILSQWDNSSAMPDDFLTVISA